MKKIVLTLMSIIVVGEIIFRIFYNVAILPVWEDFLSAIPFLDINKYISK